MPLSSNIKIVPAGPEDFAIFSDIFYEATVAKPIGRLSDTIVEDFKGFYGRVLTLSLATKSLSKVFKAVVQSPTKSGQIVAFSSWRLVGDIVDDESRFVAVPPPAAPIPVTSTEDGSIKEGVNRSLSLFEPKPGMEEIFNEVKTSFVDKVSELTTEFGNSVPSFIYMTALYVLPGWQGHGIGTAMLRWGLDFSDKNGLPMWLTATDDGKPVYLKYGFEVQTQVTAPFKSWAANFGGVIEVPEHAQANSFGMTRAPKKDK